MPDRIRFAILGTARIARRVAPHIQQSDGAKLVAVASRCADKASAFARELGIPASFGSYQAALDSPDVDAVYLPLPPSLHREWTIRAAEAGKHVLSEKPLAMNVAEVDEMVSACRQYGVVLLDGVMWYHTPRAAAMRRIVADGLLGEIRQVTSAFTFRWDEWPMDDIRMQRSTGGGSLMDLGWYCVGATLLFLNRMPTRVFATARWHNDVDVRMNGMLWFDNGLVAGVESGFDAVRRRWIEIAGSKQALVCDDFTRPWEGRPPRFWVHDTDGISSQHIVDHKPLEQCMIDGFCDLVQRGDVDHRWLSLSRKTQLVCDRLAESARSETIVEV
ncbi:MAG: Gfo/Idh/MocA family oxidoreductase [Planctomycetaceae bacterium]